MRIESAQLAKGFEAALPGHLLIKQNETVGPASQHFDGVVGIRGRLHLEAATAQEDAVRLEQVGLVVHPQYRLCRLHH